MALNPEAEGHTTKELTHEYDWRDVALYALGVGAKRSELDYLYEKRGPMVLPTYAVVPAFFVNRLLFDIVGGDLLGVVHGGQGIRLHKPFAPSGKLKTIGKVAGIYDLKRMATSVVTTETRDEDGDLVCETEWNIIYRLDGGFGGKAPPRTRKVRPPERDPDFVVEEKTSEEQALLYRLNGDLNPLHADPAIGEKAGFGHPILHGLCTYGYACRAVINSVCEGDASRMKAFNGQFRKPVWPGDTIITEGWNEDGKVIVRSSCKERPGEYGFTNAWAEVD
ncbi:MAG: MaoC family dehydratase N-terminal domain-containing protein [Deltaproteobacteria bacterium]|nr:MaoC family dehydratase N-terminal domain-containing protein [Deltaproteobacteria bacterium]